MNVCIINWCTCNLTTDTGGGRNTVNVAAAVVVPIILVLLIITIFILIFVPIGCWKRKQYQEKLVGKNLINIMCLFPYLSDCNSHQCISCTALEWKKQFLFAQSLGEIMLSESDLFSYKINMDNFRDPPLWVNPNRLSPILLLWKLAMYNVVTVSNVELQLLYHINTLNLLEF